jgi:uncharacterized protein (DUF433 family)
MNPSSGKDGLLESLFTPTYSISTTSKLTGITRWSVARYLRGYTYRLTAINEQEYWGQQPPVVKSDDAHYASFLDLIDLLFVKEFLNRGFTLQQLRPAFMDARKYLKSHHFARSEFYTSGMDIFLKLPKDGALITLLTGGQIAINEIIEKLGDKLEFEDITENGFARKWFPLGKDVPIVVDPLISFGRPMLIGYNVPTSNIYDLYLGESKKYTTVSKWFDIPVPEIETAVRFEHSLWA